MVFFQEPRTNVVGALCQRTRASGAPSLLGLPAEIWSRICTLAVVNDKEIHPDMRSKLYFRSSVHQPSITRMCRVIREETLDLFYTLNTFVIKDYRPGFPPWLLPWLRAIGPVNVRRLKGLYIESAYGEMATRFHLSNVSCQLPRDLQLVVLDSKFISAIAERDRRIGQRNELWRYHIGVAATASYGREDS